jgi:hypothetical protein
MIAFLPLLAFVATVLAAPAAEGPVLTVPNIPGTGTQGGAAPAATALVTINSISYGGTGCPQGSVGSFISADRLTFVSSHTCSHQNTFLLSNYDHRNIRQIIAC